MCQRSSEGRFADVLFIHSNILYTLQTNNHCNYKHNAIYENYFMCKFLDTFLSASDPLSRVSVPRYNSEDFDFMDDNDSLHSALSVEKTLENKSITKKECSESN